MIQCRKVLVLLVAACTMLPASQLQAQKEFKKWPAGSSPQEVGKKVAERLVTSPHQNFGQPLPPSQITYPEVATWYGALTFAKITGDKELDAKLIQRFDPLFSTEANLIPNPNHDAATTSLSSTCSAIQR